MERDWLPLRIRRERRFRWAKYGAILGLVLSALELVFWNDGIFEPWKNEMIILNLLTIVGRLVGGAFWCALAFLIAATVRQLLISDWRPEN